MHASPPSKAAKAADILRLRYPELSVEPRAYGSKGYYVAVSLPGEGSGLMLHPEAVDNGASGVKEECLERVNAFVEGRAYVPKPPTQRVYDDVMTAGPGRDDEVGP